MTKGRSQSATTKEERDITEILSLSVNSIVLVRLGRELARGENYEAERFKEEDPKTGKTSARRPEEAGQTKTKTTRSRGNKGGKSQKESGCSCESEAFQANRSEKIGRR